MENEVISSGKKEKSGCAMKTKKTQTTPKQKNYLLL